MPSNFPKMTHVWDEEMFFLQHHHMQFMTSFALSATTVVWSQRPPLKPPELV